MTQAPVMTLDAAIEHAANRAACDESACAAEHAQLAEWLRELKARREAADPHPPTHHCMCVDCEPSFRDESMLADLPPQMLGQHKTMTITGGGATAPEEVGYWFSPDAVEEKVAGMKRCYDIECANLRESLEVAKNVANGNVEAKLAAWKELNKVGAAGSDGLRERLAAQADNARLRKALEKVVAMPKSHESLRIAIQTLGDSTADTSALDAMLERGREQCAAVAEDTAAGRDAEAIAAAIRGMEIGK